MTKCASVSVSKDNLEIPQNGLSQWFSISKMTLSESGTCSTKRLPYMVNVYTLRTWIHGSVEIVGFLPSKKHVFFSVVFVASFPQFCVNVYQGLSINSIVTFQAKLPVPSQSESTPKRCSRQPWKSSTGLDVVHHYGCLDIVCISLYH